jgi:phosphoglycerate dehydrogenase-like enzyme
MNVCFGEGSSPADAVLACAPAGLVAATSLAEADVWVVGVPDATGLAAAKNLRAVVIPWAGLNEKARTALLTRPDVAVYSLHGNAAATAEMAVAHLMSCARGLALQTSQLRSGDWSFRWHDTPQQLKLSGSKACLLGYGEIGRRIGAVCRALGMDVSAVRRSPGLSEESGIRIGGPEFLKEAAEGARALVCSLPATPETRGLIDGPLLDLLAPDPIVVNVGRGAVIQEEALTIRAESGQIRRLGLDVWWRYPEPNASPQFGGAEALVLKADFGSFSPHVGSHVVEGETERVHWIADALAELAQGQEPAGRTWPERGY